MVIYYEPCAVCVTFIYKAKARGDSVLFSVAYECECIRTGVDRNIAKNTGSLLADQHSGLRANRYEIIAHL
ncbi:MAG: hypothetical protein QF913_10265, partial [Nitrospinaceae bacterium]|nr:hypothetical protein [Nitrospinaceae bacterium]